VASWLATKLAFLPLPLRRGQSCWTSPIFLPPSGLASVGQYMAVQGGWEEARGRWGNQGGCSRQIVFYERERRGGDATYPAILFLRRLLGMIAMSSQIWRVGHKGGVGHVRAVHEQRSLHDWKQGVRRAGRNREEILLRSREGEGHGERGGEGGGGGKGRTYPLVGVKVISETGVVLLNDNPGGLLHGLGANATHSGVCVERRGKGGRWWSWGTRPASR